MIDLRHKVGGPTDDTAKCIRVPAEKLCRAVNHEICTESDGLLINGRGERVVDNHPGLVVMGYRCQAGEVDNFDRWVRRAFQVHGLASPADCRLDCFVIAGITQRHLDAESRQEFDEEFIRSPVAVLNRNDAVPRRQQCKKRVADRRHAARKTCSSFRHLESSHLFLESSNGWICVSAINVSALISLRHLEPFVQIVIAERHAEGYGYLRGALPTLATLARPHGAGSKSCGRFVAVASAH